MTDAHDRVAIERCSLEWPRGRALLRSMLDDSVVVGEDAVADLVLAQILRDVLDWNESG
jgi:hypothetical protein